jgi:hypothetical protein
VSAGFAALGGVLVRLADDVVFGLDEFEHAIIANATADTASSLNSPPS